MIERHESSTVNEFRCIEFAPSVPVAASALLYLHGSGERGTDLESVKRYGLPALLARGAVTVNSTVICPQLEADREWEPERVARFISALRRRYERIALMGYSWGGIGVCEVVARYGAIATPAVAIAGRAPGAVSAPQAGVAFVAIQGEHDTWADAGALCHSVRSHGGVAHEVALAGQGHYVSEIALEHPLLQSVMLASGFEISFLERVG